MDRPPRDPEQEIGVDHEQVGIYTYVAGARGPRVINIDGQAYEHCADDPDGCWLYRAVTE